MRGTIIETNVVNQFKVTEVELVYRRKTKAEERQKVVNSESAWRILLESWDMNRIELVEEFKILLLDRKHSCLGISNISTGGISACIVDPKIIFATALKAKASSIILAHNHPSGNLEPSQADIILTRKLTEGGKLLEIAVPDHLIVTPHAWYSMADNGLIY